MGLLVLLSPTMITISFREEPGGPLHDVQSAGATALRPLQVGAERVVRPFRDAYGWFAELFSAKGRSSGFALENERLRQEAVQFRDAYAENRPLREFLDYKAPLTYPRDFDPVFAAVISHPSAASSCSRSSSRPGGTTASASTTPSSTRTGWSAA